jgi:hypothetical protein
MFLYTTKKVVTAGCISMLILVACGDHKPNKPSITSDTNKPAMPATAHEDFDTFFEKFNKDSAFQKDRTVFPLKVTITGGEGESNSTKFISIQKWHSFNLLSEKDRVIQKRKINKQSINVIYGVNDTGIHINLQFRLNDGKWRLVYVEDGSD